MGPHSRRIVIHKIKSLQLISAGWAYAHMNPAKPLRLDTLVGLKTKKGVRQGVREESFRLGDFDLGFYRYRFPEYAEDWAVRFGSPPDSS